jgi:hypothetical protein
MTADPLLNQENFGDIQAIKFDQIGDFNYMIFTERNLQKVDTSLEDHNSVLTASLYVFSPEHDQPVFEMSLPFYNPQI